jgi:hypothetical protein
VGGVKDRRVWKAVEVRNRICSKLVWREGLHEGTGMVVIDVSTISESKMKALEEVQQDYREAKDTLKDYIHDPLIARGIMKEKSLGYIENIFEMTAGVDDETIIAFSHWLNPFEPLNCQCYCRSS